MKNSELHRILMRAGWYVDRQRGTSHIIMKHPDRTDFIVVPKHGSKEVGTGLAASILKQAGLR
jgi:predicted RNA binding protein YcfA (HicA-like mRNA interferase family)